MCLVGVEGTSFNNVHISNGSKKKAAVFYYIIKECVPYAPTTKYRCFYSEKCKIAP